ESEGVGVQVVSFPSWEIFEKQTKEYKESVLPVSVTARVAVETGVKMGWAEYVGCKGAIISLDHFGASAPDNVLYKEFGFTVENIVAAAKKAL
ncbi:MAG: transketolase, partial [Ignavibacteria bacterium]|nr:transketolase [Ignavibacteria bacterium]